MKSPRVLVLAGLEPSGRMGLWADMAAIASVGGVPLGVPTAMTAQGTKEFRVDAVSISMLRLQLRTTLELGRVDAIKLGMVPNPRTLDAILEEVGALKCPWVIDPVVSTSRGQVLSRLTPRHYLRLAGLRRTLTPNAEEAAWMLDRPGLRTLDEAQDAAEELIRLGFSSVVLKGGHLRGAPHDVVARARHLTVVLPGARLHRSRKTHRGSGCRFAGVMSVELGRGGSDIAAATAAKKFVHNWILRPSHSGE